MSDIKKYIKPNIDKPDFERTTVKLTKEQHNWVKTKRINLSLLIRDHLTKLMKGEK